MSESAPEDGRNEEVAQRCRSNILRVVRQVHHHTTSEESLDLVFYSNGVQVATVEVKTDFKQGLTGSKKNLSDNGNPLKFLDLAIKRVRAFGPARHPSGGKHNGAADERTAQKAAKGQGTTQTREPPAGNHPVGDHVRRTFSGVSRLLVHFPDDGGTGSLVGCRVPEDRALVRPGSRALHRSFPRSFELCGSGIPRRRTVGNRQQNDVFQCSVDERTFRRGNGRSLRSGRTGRAFRRRFPNDFDRGTSFVGDGRSRRGRFSGIQGSEGGGFPFCRRGLLGLRDRGP